MALTTACYNSSWSFVVLLDHRTHGGAGTADVGAACVLHGGCLTSQAGASYSCGDRTAGLLLTSACLLPSCDLSCCERACAPFVISLHPHKPGPCLAGCLAVGMLWAAAVASEQWEVSAKPRRLDNRHRASHLRPCGNTLASNSTHLVAFGHSSWAFVANNFLVCRARRLWGP